MLLILSIIVPLSIGILLMVATRQYAWTYRGTVVRLTRLKFSIVAVLTLIVAILVTVVWGPGAAQAQAAHGYQQFLNGSIVNTRSEKYQCTRDGSCQQTYQCDPYYVTVVYAEQVPAGTDAKGNTIYTTVVKTREELHYHDCPYATAEYSYWLDDSLGRTITVASHIFAGHPRQWRSGAGIPGTVATGIPTAWLTSQARLAQHDAEPVTLIGSYTNYILPSSDAVLRQYSASIDSYRRAGLLLAHTAKLAQHDMFYDYGRQAQKIQFVGLQPTDLATWQDRLMRFNAALGSVLRGDLHIVVVPGVKINSPDDYVNALQAFWLNDLGKWGFPKNGILVVIGTTADGSHIAWARAQTGMPVGNGEMRSAISLRLPNAMFNPDSILGKITADVQPQASGKFVVHYTHSSALLDSIMFSQYPFARACMACTSKGDSGTGFVYLSDTIPVPMSSQIWMFIIVLLVSLIGWTTAVLINPRSRTPKFVPAINKSSGYTPRRRY